MLRQTIRALSRAPAFALATVVTLAIAIGATAAIFSVVDGVLLEPLPFPIQRLIQEPLLRAARKAGRWDLVPNLAGQVAGMLSARRPAREILLEMVDEAADTITTLQRLLA